MVAASGIQMGLEESMGEILARSPPSFNALGAPITSQPRG